MNGKSISILFLSLLALAGCDALEGMTGGVGESEQERTAYAIGYTLGGNLSPSVADNLPQDELLLGLKDGINGRDSQIDWEEMEELFQAFQMQMLQSATDELETQRLANVARGDAYRAEYAAGDGVKSTGSGLLYRIERPGGRKPAVSDKVEVNYRGTLVDGTEFDSSFSRGEPSTFPLDGVIPGWTEGLQLVGVGGRIELVLPPELAYGEQGAGDIIGPGETLVFQVDLLSIVDDE